MPAVVIDLEHVYYVVGTQAELHMLYLYNEALLFGLGTWRRRKANGPGVDAFCIHSVRGS